MTAIPKVKTEEVPIACCLDRTRQVFRITRNKGKSLANGGFGFSLPDDESTSSTVDYLFIEEVYFLVERGLLEAYDGDTRLNVQGILQLLSACGMSLPALLVYAHVRAQNYRVIRHTPHRRRILDQMEPLRHLYKRKRKQLDTQEETDGSSILPQNTPATTSSSEKDPAEQSTSGGRKQLEHLRQKLREDAAQAPAPVLGSLIAYELYEPDSQFRRSAPGLPDIYVTATTALQFDALQTLLREADGIPLRTAVVSEAGTVVMLGVTDYGVPVISKAGSKE